MIQNNHIFYKNLSKFSVLFIFIAFICVSCQENSNSQSQQDSVNYLQNLEAKLTPNQLTDAKVFQSHNIIRPFSKSDSLELQLSEYQYDNGARVFMIHTPYSKNEVKLKAISWGGYSIFEADEDKKMLAKSGLLIANSGVGALSKQELDKLLAFKKMKRFDFTVDELTERFETTFEAQQYEFVLKLIYQYFTAFSDKNIDMKSLKAALKAQSSFEKKASVLDSVKSSFYSHLYDKNRDYPDFYEDKKVEKALGLIKERYADGGDFTFVFVGDMTNMDNVVGLLDHYIGNLPKNDKGEFFKFLPTQLKANPNDLKVKKEESQLGFAGFIHYEDSLVYNADNMLNVWFLEQTLKQKIATSEFLKSTSLSKGIQSGIQHYPLSKVFFDIPFNSVQEKMQLETLISQLQTTKLSIEEAKNLRNQLKSSYLKEKYTDNPFLIQLMTENIMEGLAYEKFINRADFESYCNSITPDKINKLANKFWNNKKKTVAVME